MGQETCEEVEEKIEDDLGMKMVGWVFLSWSWWEIGGFSVDCWGWFEDEDWGKDAIKKMYKLLNSILSELIWEIWANIFGLWVYVFGWFLL